MYVFLSKLVFIAICVQESAYLKKNFFLNVIICMCFSVRFSISVHKIFFYKLIQCFICSTVDVFQHISLDCFIISVYLNVFLCLNVCFSKKDSPTRLSTLSFFHHSRRPGPLPNGVKQFSFWFHFRRDIQNLVYKILTLRSMILRGVKINLILGQW